MMFKRSFLTIVGTLLLAFLATFLYALLLFGNLPMQLGENNLNLSRVEKGAQIVRQFIFVNGQRGASLITSATDELIGLTAPEFVDQNPQWRVLSFTPHQI